MKLKESIDNIFYVLYIFSTFFDILCGYYFYGLPFLNKKNTCDKISKRITKLGVVFMKMAQWVSCTENSLPKTLVESLVKLQSSVEYKMGENKLPKHNLIKSIEEIPIGVGSIASVHRCILTNCDEDKEYIIKIINKEKHKKLIKNCKQINELLYWIKKTFFLRSLCFDVQDILNEMIHQCDLHNEAKNIAKMAKFIEKSPYLKVPTVFHVEDNWMIQEFSNGISLEKIRNQYPEYFGDYCTKLYGFFNTMCFDFYFMHADIHDGNSLYELNEEDPDKSKIVLLDFGFCIQLSKKMADTMEDFQIGLLDDDMDKVCDTLPKFFSNKKKVILDKVGLRKIWKHHIGDQMSPDKFVAEKIPQILLDICNYHELEFNHYSFYWVLNNQLLLKNTFYIDDFGEKITFPVMKGTLAMMNRDDWNLPSRFTDSNSELFKAYDRNKTKLFAA